MAALHEALKALSPVDFSVVPADDADLKSFLTESFKSAQLLVDSVPIPPLVEDLISTTGRLRSNTAPSFALPASEVSLLSASSSPPPPDVGALQKEWGKPLKLSPKENPLGVSVYKLAGKDGKGAWFARRSVHEGLGYEKWRMGLEREFPETMKVQGSPGEGNVRGIGAERRVECKAVSGVGKMEVYQLSAQFPGPTTPRDFVTLLLTSDTALTERGGLSQGDEIPRHFIVISIPCKHADCQERGGFIRGQYQSVELIREIPLKKSVSTTNLSFNSNWRSRPYPVALGRETILGNAMKAKQPSSEESEQGVAGMAVMSETNVSESRKRGKTTSIAELGSEAKGEYLNLSGHDVIKFKTNKVEWIMLTRSDPGGTVPRFMVERGTPGSIVADASKFHDWICGKEMEDFGDDTPDPSEVGDEAHQAHEHRQEKPLHYYETNSHPTSPDGQDDSAMIPQNVGSTEGSGSGIHRMVTGAVGEAGAIVATHPPIVITSHLSDKAISTDGGGETADSARRKSILSVDSESSVGSFESALEGIEEWPPRTTTTDNDSNSQQSQVVYLQEKELQKLQVRKRKLGEKLAKVREKGLAKRSEDSEREVQAIARAEERHQREVAKQEEKYKKELAKLEAKREKERERAEDKRRKALERDERTRLSRELDECKAERDLLRKEMEILRTQVGELQVENTALAARLGKLGAPGEAVLKDVRDELVGSAGRLRAGSIKGMGLSSSSRNSSFRVDGAASGKENLSP